jgi:hypothetical protein
MKNFIVVGKNRSRPSGKIERWKIGGIGTMVMRSTKLAGPVPNIDRTATQIN